MTFEVHKSFLDLLRQLFESFEYDVEISHGPGDEGIDLIVRDGERKVFIEAKVNRTKSTPPLTNALLRLRFVMQSKNAENGVLITSSIVEPVVREYLSKKYEVEIWDRSILVFLSRKSIELQKQLENILQELKQSGEENIYEGIYHMEKFDVNDIWKKSIHTNLVVQPQNKGDLFCKELKKVQPGKAQAGLFEKKCEEILKYLFDGDLSGWTPQNTTDDTLHRFDLISRIISQNDFWRFISRDFKTRFVIFEFKNYTEPITQSQIYTTEKYLYITALRTFAIIISREGADRNAETAMKGSLREHGKLIICLNLDEICKMLHMKDNGDDPNTYLSDKIDKMLMQLSR